ncbi:MULTISPECIES: hypothetical protein [unclassified Gilliamella]|uniref:hypothetical protein n=1 Tax=unclassified Gilliamella TaxID=2685620 RepID=UPI00080DAD83|nr:hypothetical protein [Gilliamella apicola]OCG34807.1 hypothetical protein A9G32_08605 [Gilliamella apicola]OCG47663.1 hypothetical protein A9G26_11130 [Gilliamella apicola]OCG50658.1 hypothetical protein A9G27_01285 [Gilliamella apicola]
MSNFSLGCFLDEPFISLLVSEGKKPLFSALFSAKEIPNVIRQLNNRCINAIEPLTKIHNRFLETGDLNCIYEVFPQILVDIRKKAKSGSPKTAIKGENQTNNLGMKP